MLANKNEINKVENLATFLSEPIDCEEAYTEKLIKAFEKVIKDEITAALLYVKLGQMIPVKVIQEELVKHTFDEFKHYSMLLEYAFNHGFMDKINIRVDIELLNSKNIYDGDDYKKLVKLIQDLEQQAINDYEVLITYTSTYKDHDTYELVEEILEDEREHFDDLAFALDQKRKLVTKFSRPKMGGKNVSINRNVDIDYDNMPTNINKINNGNILLDEEDE